MSTSFAPDTSRSGLRRKPSADSDFTAPHPKQSRRASDPGIEVLDGLPRSLAVAREVGTAWERRGSFFQKGGAAETLWQAVSEFRRQNRDRKNSGDSSTVSRYDQALRSLDRLAAPAEHVSAVAKQYRIPVRMLTECFALASEPSRPSAAERLLPPSDATTPVIAALGTPEPATPVDVVPIDFVLSTPLAPLTPIAFSAPPEWMPSTPSTATIDDPATAPTDASPSTAGTSSHPLASEPAASLPSHDLRADGESVQTPGESKGSIGPWLEAAQKFPDHLLSRKTTRASWTCGDMRLAVYRSLTGTSIQDICAEPECRVSIKALRAYSATVLKMRQRQQSEPGWKPDFAVVARREELSATTLQVAFTYCEGVTVFHTPPTKRKRLPIPP